jgi:hypothetical protein
MIDFDLVVWSTVLRSAGEDHPGESSQTDFLHSLSSPGQYLVRMMAPLVDLSVKMTVENIVQFLLVTGKTLAREPTVAPSA